MTSACDGVDLPDGREHDLVIIGAGMEALHLAARLPEALQEKCVVVDSSGGWLVSWQQRLERLGSAHLRSPATQHPHASPLALQQYVEQRCRQQDLIAALGSPAMPTPALMLDFCKAKVIRKLPKALQHVVHDTVTQVVPQTAVGAVPGGSNGADTAAAISASPAGCTVHLASGAVLHARAVVYTPANRRPVVPAWARQLRQPLASSQAPGASSATDDGRLGAGIATWDTVDMRCADVAGRRVVVVGGGVASATLAVGAVAQGAAAVTLVTRRQLQQQAFETGVGWWGNKQLNEYRQQHRLGQRLTACRRARRQATLDTPTWRQLAEATAAGKLTVLEAFEVAEATPAGVAMADDTQPAWELLLRRRAAGAGKASPAATATASPFQQAVTELSGPAEYQKEQPDSHLGAMPGAHAAAVEAEGDAPGGNQLRLQADLVWLACASAYDLATDPVLSRLQQNHPTITMAGYPWVDEENLCWPGVPLFLAGRAALLAVGPCSGDLPGMRLAADRIAKSLKRLNYADAPAWEAAAHKLAVLDVAPSPAGTGAGALHLEAEGVMWEEPRVKVSVARPSHLVDVSDLPPDLPRREVQLGTSTAAHAAAQDVQRYTFTDCEFEICVILQLDEAVPLEKVRVNFQAQSLDAWAIGESAAYHLPLPRLYGRVLPKRCAVKVKASANKVYLLLHKESDAEWRFLKG